MDGREILNEELDLHNIAQILNYMEGGGSISFDPDTLGTSENDQDTAPNISYDTSLPTQHSYLGNNLEELSGRIVLDDDSCVQLPLVALPGIVLVPGQTLPLHLFNIPMMSMVKRIIANDKTFGMVNCSDSRYADSGSSPELANIGTTAEVRSYREEEENGLLSIRVKAEGRQRFKVIETWRTIDGSIVAKVQILPEVMLPELGSGVRLQSLERFGILPRLNFNQMTKASKKKYDRFNFSSYTRWPSWVYKQYDVRLLMERVRKELSSWGSIMNSDSSLLQNPSEFSFWVTANLPLDDTLRLSLLSFNSPIQRLRCTLSILEKCTVLCCKQCSAVVASRRDIFCMSLDGPLATYVNPFGFVHETITVYKAQGLTMWGEPSAENSWFPGYAWMIVNCRSCHNHMGWKFTTLDARHMPAKFWGLCRSALEQGLLKQNWKPIF